ncbi:MAG: hypothetical protein A2Z18_11305 [Armatimonadetes bacterium RBG_16_58_9]|nr:MAG: hypothetical protein A2Z18_11305 [Armatimonadetes bacterium RBG_16_58_9]
MKLTNNRSGITLVEVMVSSLVLSLAGTALVAMLIGSLRGWSFGTSKDGATSYATVALQKLNNDIRDGRSAQISYEGLTLTVTFPALVEDPVTHESMYDLSANDPVPRLYYVQNDNLLRSIGGQITVLGRGVSSASFGASGGTVTINLQATEQVGTATSSQNVTGRIFLRNYRG